MVVEEVLSDFQSNIHERQQKALKLCLADDDLFLNKEILTQAFYLLNHENYHLRDETEEILNFVVKYIPESHILLSNLLTETLSNKENSNELMFRCLKLFVLLDKESLSTQFVMNLLNSETNYAQGFMTFVLRDILKQDPEFLNSVLDIIVKEKENIPSDTKKVICWLFWNNPTIFNSNALNTLLILVNDEDREVRRLVCEILVQMIDDLRYRDKIIHIFEQRVIDESWRVQKIAIKGLILSTLGQHPLNSKFWDRIVGLFWDTAWQVRRNICQVLPFLLPLQDEKNSMFLELLIAALDDENWEVREGSAISLNQQLDLGRNKYRYILNKILDLTDDPHEQVRKVSCAIICERFNSLENKNEAKIRVIQLLEDERWIVRKEAIMQIEKLITSFSSEKYSSEILEILMKRLIDGNLEVREEAWNTLTKLRQGFSDSQIQRFIPTILGMLSFSQSDIRLNVCKFISNYEKAWISNSNLILENFKPLLEDEDPVILSYVWDAITDNKKLIIEAHHFLTQLSRKLHELYPSSAIQVCKASDKLKLLNRSTSIRDRFIRLLSEDIDHNLRITILSTLSQYKEVYSSIDPQILINLINQGQWDIQRALIPYLVYYVKNESEDFSSDFNFQDIIIDFIIDPLTGRFASTDDQKSNIVIDNSTLDFTEESMKLYFDIANDDARFKKWIDLERKFDFITKVDHPLIAEIKKQFQEILSQHIKGINNKFGYLEIFNQGIDLDTPKKIVTLMRQQYAALRECFLEEIEKEIDILQPQFKKLNNVIIQQLLDDSILKIRNYAWNFFNKNQQKSNKVMNDNLHALVDHVNGTYEDTRINAISVLLSHLNIKEPENEFVLDEIIAKLDDPNYVVRNQVWKFINKELNLTYPRYLPFVQKILNLLSHSSVHNRKEATEYIENNFQTFSSIIETYPQPNKILHIIGTILIQREEFQQGLMILEEMVSRNPSELNNWLAIAVSYFSMDQPQDAISILKKAKSIDVFDYRIYEILSTCLLDLGEHFEAQKYNEIASILSKK